MKPELSQLMPLPERIVVNTGEQGSVTETIDRFFKNAVQFLKDYYRASPQDIQLKSGELSFPGGVSDNRVTYLIFRDQPVAAVFETRTEFNKVAFTFMRNTEKLSEFKA